MPTLTVDVPVADRSLISLVELKAELGVDADDTSSDSLLTGWIRAASDVVSAACRIAPDQKGRRTLLEEQATITFAPDEVPAQDRAAPLILPWRVPVEVTSASINGEPLALPGGIEEAPMAALVYRLGAGCRQRWPLSRIVLGVVTGFAPGDIPAVVRTAVTVLCRQQWEGRDRDLTLRAREVTGGFREEFWVGGIGGNEGAIPASIMADLSAAGLVAPPGAW